MKKTLILSVLFIGMGLANAQKTAKVESQHGTAKQTDKHLEIDGIGHNSSYTLNGGNAEVSGGSNVITINGYLDKLEVSGTDNTVYVDKVTRIILEGGNNKVFYKSSPTKTGKPGVAITGVGNSVKKK
ncbi:DUF3060 domain-containing protein [Chryseobacterium oranimense]|uniref:DUF3060 domain-containing protein n=1 Tax=Chryseobacterium oranimense TaxID=421058 RepID=UPI0021AE517E|nr:DUF3060 domain-containing protein [Chryseobacterium oranimense]UWX61691.1 DUF3060 domain-containing protein [Chryseobacterium oranimense]